MKTKLDRKAPEFLDEAESDNEMEVDEIDVETVGTGDENMILNGMISNGMDYEVIGNGGTENTVSGAASTSTEQDRNTQPAHPMPFLFPVLPTPEERLRNVITALGPGPLISIAAQLAYFNGNPYTDFSMDFGEMDYDHYAHTSSEIPQQFASVPARRHRRAQTAGILTGRIPSMAYNVGLTRESIYQASNRHPAGIEAYVGYSAVIELNATVYELTQLRNSNLGLGVETIRHTSGTFGNIAQSDEEHRRLCRSLLICFIRLHGQLHDFLVSVGQNQSTDLTEIMNECYDALSLEGPVTEVSQRRMRNALTGLIVFIRDQLRRFGQGQSATAQ